MIHYTQSYKCKKCGASYKNHAGVVIHEFSCGRDFKEAYRELLEKIKQRDKSNDNSK
jgi:transposase-like protein